MRNPYDRLISHYYYRARNMDDAPDFAEWCEQNPHKVGINADQYLIDGEPVIDVFVRFEHFDEDLRTLEERFPGLNGLADTFASIKAKGGIRPKKKRGPEVYKGADVIRRLVEKECGYEIEKFGYTLD